MPFLLIFSSASSTVTFASFSSDISSIWSSYISKVVSNKCCLIITMICISTEGHFTPRKGRTYKLVGRQCVQMQLPDRDTGEVIIYYPRMMNLSVVFAALGLNLVFNTST